MITQPIIILGTPRSGTTILQRCLAMHPDLWHLTSESHFILEGPLHPAHTGYSSNRVTGEAVTDAVITQMRDQFYQSSVNLNRLIADPAWLFSARSLTDRISSKLAIQGIGRMSRRKKPSQIRLLEKTPKNTLRVPLLERLFPDARYIWMQRQAAENIDSLIAGWQAVDRIGPFTRHRYGRSGYPIANQLNLQDYDDKWWKFVLVPAWRQLEGQTIADVAAWQYIQCNRFVEQDLAEIAAKRTFSVQYEAFVHQPVDVVRAIFQWAELPASAVAEHFAQRLPRINTTHHKQDAGLRHPEAVQAALARLA